MGVIQALFDQIQSCYVDYAIEFDDNHIFTSQAKREGDG
jgi:hypothetical protein